MELSWIEAFGESEPDFNTFLIDIYVDAVVMELSWMEAFRESEPDFNTFTTFRLAPKFTHAQLSSTSLYHRGISFYPFHLLLHSNNFLDSPRKVSWREAFMHRKLRLISSLLFSFPVPTKSTYFYQLPFIVDLFFPFISYYIQVTPVHLDSPNCWLQFELLKVDRLVWGCILQSAL